MAKKKGKKKSVKAPEPKSEKAPGMRLDKRVILLAAVAVTVFIVALGAAVLLPRGSGAKTFQDNGSALELRDGKPVVRLYSTTWCPHCLWIKETFDSVAKQYVAEGKIVAYHWELDTFDDTLTGGVETVVPESELAVFRSVSPGGHVPAFVFGGKLVRIGNGYEAQEDLEKERQEFIAVIEQLLKEAKSQ